MQFKEFIFLYGGVGLRMSFQKLLAAFLPEDEPSDREMKLINEEEDYLSKGEYISLDEFRKEVSARIDEVESGDLTSINEEKIFSLLKE